VDGIEIHWPNREVERVALPTGVDRYYMVQEGKGVIPSVYDAGAGGAPKPHGTTR
jgi:enediyne biosynthesis protein E4